MPSTFASWRYYHDVSRCDRLVDNRSTLKHQSLSKTFYIFIIYKIFSSTLHSGCPDRGLGSSPSVAGVITWDQDARITHWVGSRATPPAGPGTPQNGGPGPPQKGGCRDTKQCKFWRVSSVLIQGLFCFWGFWGVSGGSRRGSILGVKNHPIRTLADPWNPAPGTPGLPSQDAGPGARRHEIGAWCRCD